MAWTTPKTNWVLSDRFNISDYNRIKNNLQYLMDRVTHLFKPFQQYDMGADVVGYTGYRTATQFNHIEQNLENMNKAALNRDYGATKTFYANGAFIKYDELNRIESACVNIRTICDLVEAGIVDRRLQYVAGRYKEAVRVI